MELFKKKTFINFMDLRKLTGFVSLVSCIIAILLILVKGLALSSEFTGGIQVELRFANPVEPDQIKEQLKNEGFNDLKVQNYGSTRDILIRMANEKTFNGKNIAEQIQSLFTHEGQSVVIRRTEYVGSEVGTELAEQGSVAVLLAILATMIYIALRFEYHFALSAAIALCHDVIIVLGIFSLFQIEFNLATLAAILAVLGYSLNDTIVVFDRVRENLRKIRKKSTIFVINLSINQTLSRTLITSWLTLLVVLALLFFGGKSLFGFSLALTLGIITGTYSSIYVAGACALSLGLSRADLLPKSKIKFDNMP